MKLQKIKVDVLPQTDVVRSAIHAFCAKNADPKTRHNAISTLTTILANSADYPVEQYVETGCTGKHEHHNSFHENNITGIPVVRAGVVMADAFKRTVPTAQIQLVGAKRGHDKDGKMTCNTYLDELDENLSDKSAYFLDTVLASGVSLDAAIQVAKNKGLRDENITILTAIAAHEGISVINQAHPRARIIAATMAEGLNEKKYLFNPTPGDAGDNLFGETEKWQDVIANYKKDSSLGMYK